jgi:hypothetical protein
MKRQFICLLLMMGCILLVSFELQAQGALGGELRVWKDSTGQFSIEAVFVRFADDQVVLLRNDNKKEITFSLAKLTRDGIWLWI